MRPNAMAHVPLTRPSHATILSGLLPWEVGVRDNLAPAELPPSPLLAEILKGAGFRTARVRVFDRPGAARRIRARIRSVRRRFSENPERRPPEHAAEAGRRNAARRDRLARKPARGRPHLPVGPPVRAARSVRAARTLRVAISRSTVRRRGGLHRRARRSAGRRARAAWPQVADAARRGVGSRRGARRA